MLTNNDMQDIFEIILHKGIRTYQAKNSKVMSITHKEDSNKKGAIFGFRSKENMQESRGIVITSVEGLLANAEKFTHWTPNVFGYGAYIDKNRSIVSGHEEEKLNQINTFVIDLDFGYDNKPSVDMVILKSIDTGFVPTLVLDTPKGYHLYFVLEQASYVSNVNNYKSLCVSKAISKNLRYKYAELFPEVDLGCNNFGIFRMPTCENVVHYEPGLTYDFSTLKKWSMNYSKKTKREQKAKLSVVRSAPAAYKQINAAWFKALINATNIDCGAGEGRNNTVYTLSLACFSSEVSLENCLNMMDEFNTNLSHPLQHKEVKKIVKSAYKGNFYGASKEYINLLVQKWVKSDQLASFKQQTNGKISPQLWVKHAKKREERQRSHYDEWSVDLLAYLDKQLSEEQPTFNTSLTAISEAISIPLSSLKVLLNMLKEKQALFVKTKKGRGGYTSIITRKMVVFICLKNKQEQTNNFMANIAEKLPSATLFVMTIVQQLQAKKTAQENTQPLPTSLFDTG